MKKKRVVITGMGVLAPNGIGVNEFSEAIFSGRCGIDYIKSFDASNLRIKTAGEVYRFDAANYLPMTIVRKTDRFVHLGLTAADEAIKDANFKSDTYLKNAAVIIGSGQGGLSFHEQTIVKFLEEAKRPIASAVPRITSNAISAYIAIYHKIYGINQVISTACSSGAQAIGNAFRQIQYGLCDVAVTGGVEAPISPVMVEMYSSMMVLAEQNFDELPETLSRPFDLNRNGFVLSEGAGVLVLESLDSALARDAEIYAELCGFGSNCGAYHMVTPNPSGEDASIAMKNAIDDAELEPGDIDYICAHGTSTKWNDLAETNAVKMLLQEKANHIPISSIKSMIGHTIGAAGAIQLIAACLAMKKEVLPPTINLKTKDPACDLDYVEDIGRCKKINNIMSNSFGFGSNNAVLIIRRYS